MVQADLQDLVFSGTVYNEVNWYTAMSAAENATSDMMIGLPSGVKLEITSWYYDV